MFTLGARSDGARSHDGRIEGTYLHGAFTSDSFRRAWLARAGATADAGLSYHGGVDKALDQLADGVEAALDIDALFDTARRPGWRPDHA